MCDFKIGLLGISGSNSQRLGVMITNPSKRLYIAYKKHRNETIEVLVANFNDVSASTDT